MGTIDAAGSNDLYVFDVSANIWKKLPKVGKVKTDGTSHRVP